MPSISQFIATELFIGLEIDHCPAVCLLKGKIDHAFDERATIVAPGGRHFTASPTLSCSMTRLVQERMRQCAVRALRGGINLLCRCTLYTTVNGGEMLDRAQIAI